MTGWYAPPKRKIRTPLQKNTVNTVNMTVFNVFSRENTTHQPNFYLFKHQLRALFIQHRHPPHGRRGEILHELVLVRNLERLDC